MQIAHRDECTETGAGATRSSDGVGQGDGLCKCGHLVGNQFSALPFIYGLAFAIYTRPPVEKPLQFLALRSGKKERKKKKKKLALLLQRPRRVLEDVGRLNFNGSTRNERLTRRKKLVESAALFVVEIQKKKFLELVQK